MTNMRTVSQDDRAKMAREYMRGGMAPYQAARNTGFCRVGIMQEAIRAMEVRETEEAAPRAGQTKYEPDPATTEEAVEETPVGSADDEEISLPDATVAEMFEDDKQETPKPIYPFLKPGETRKKGLEMMLQTGRIRVQLFEKDGNAMFQIKDGESGHYVMLRADRLRELREMIDLCLDAMAIEDRYRVE